MVFFCILSICMYSPLNLFGYWTLNKHYYYFTHCTLVVRRGTQIIDCIKHNINKSTINTCTNVKDTIACIAIKHVPTRV